MRDDDHEFNAPRITAYYNNQFNIDCYGGVGVGFNLDNAQIDRSVFTLTTNGW